MSKYEFQAEINQLLSLIINAFYSNKDVFLREMLSNSSDAIDKMRYMSLTDSSKVRPFEIKLQVSEDKKSLYIEDNGIGMNKEDLIKNLGTIANSGTKQFMENLKEGNADVNLIGQFGVGFYSCYLVAENVKVYSKKCDDDVCYLWESNAGGTFTIDEVSQEYCTNGGTRVELTMKDSCLDYLQETKLTTIIKEHCQYLTYPIKLLTVRTETKEEEEEEEEEEKEVVVPVVDSEEKEVVVPVVDSEEKEVVESKKKTVEYEVEEWIQLNQEKPLWLKKPDDVTKEEYASFYKSLTNDWDDHLAVKHFRTEGQIEFKAMLFLPKKQTNDIFAKTSEKNNIKLYVKRVFIMDNCEKLVPEWLSCISGIVDSEDLPLNVSREMLQQNNLMKIIKKNLVKKAIEMFNELSEDVSEEGLKTFSTFYENFSKNIKLGIHEDSKNRTKLMNLLRFESCNSETGKMISLQNYVEAMKEDQKNIYFITGENSQSLKNTPFVQGVVKKGFDVLFMTEAIDEYIMPHITTFAEHTLVNITKENADIEGAKVCEDDTKKYQGFCKKVKDMLGDQVDKVNMSSLLTDEPCCVTSTTYGWSANMERIMKAQTLQTNSMSQQASFMSKKNLELNPNHVMICKLFNNYENTSMTDDTLKQIVELLFQTSLISSGYTHDDPSSFTKKVYNLISNGVLDDSIDTNHKKEEDELVNVDCDNIAVHDKDKLEEID